MIRESGRRPQRGHRRHYRHCPTGWWFSVTSEAGESFLDKMIAMVEGAARKKTPNEIALQILAGGPFHHLCAGHGVPLRLLRCSPPIRRGCANPTSVTSLVALLVCLAPTTIGALLSAIGIAGMSRLNQANVLAMSGRAIEAAGDVDILLLDKTGTITLGNRQACGFHSGGRLHAQRSWPTPPSSPPWRTRRRRAAAS